MYPELHPGHANFQAARAFTFVSSAMIIPRPYQEASVARYLALPVPRRLILAHPLSAGKSFEAMYLLEKLKPAKMLLVAPAGVLPQWARHLRSQFTNQECGCITKGRSAAGSKPALARREAAYAAPWRLVSYGLLSECFDAHYDMIIFDEIHALRAENSQQSELALRLCRGNPEADILGLSGTVIPNEARQIFNPVDTLLPGFLGERTKTDGAAYRFLERHCHKEIRHGHNFYYGCKDPAALRRVLDPILDTLDPDALRAQLPQLTVEPIYLDKPKATKKVVSDWLATVPEGLTVGVFAHLHETAQEAALALKNPVVAGQVDPVRRDAKLQEAKLHGRPFVGTIMAFNEGIDLSFIQAALVLELVPEMKTMTQFIGRFARDGGLPCRVDLVIPPTRSKTANVLAQRISTFTQVISSSRTEALALAALSEREMTEDQFLSQMQALADRVEKREALRGLIEEESDDD